MVFWSSWLICSDHRLYLVYTTQTERNHRVTIPTSILTVHDKTYLVGNASDNDRDDWRGAPPPCLFESVGVKSNPSQQKIF